MLLVPIHLPTFRIIFEELIIQLQMLQTMPNIWNLRYQQIRDMILLCLILVSPITEVLMEQELSLYAILQMVLLGQTLVRLSL